MPEEKKPQKPVNPRKITTKCNGCKICPPLCPTESIFWGSGHYVIDADTCISCGVCSDVCPEMAVMFVHNPEEFDAAWAESQKEDLEFKKKKAAADAGPVLDPAVAALLNELRAIKDVLTPIVKSLSDNPSQPLLLLKAGQTVDRIIKLAAALGYKEFVGYIQTIKVISELASKSKNSYAHGQVKDFIKMYAAYLERMANSLHEPKLIAQVITIINQEKGKAENLIKKTFSK